jgi:serine/threonine protein kinase
MDALGPGDPTEIGGHRLVDRLGAGGMGVVYRGITADGEPVAIKVIREEYADDREFRQRFAAEVAACRAVTGRCTARVLAADATAASPYLVTEFVAGQTLSEHVAEHGPLPTIPLRALALGLAEALGAIHATGLVHRDLKPSNVLLSARGPKVVDFGIAAAADGTAVTRSGQLLGSPGWMAPEQISGHGVGPALDVFS